MNPISSKKVKILKESSRFVQFLFIERNATMQVPRRVFRRRMENGLYEVVNPEILKPVL